LNRLAASFILGYHGCDKTVGDAIVSGAKAFQGSDNDYDWLGSGIYFWESSPKRGLEFAEVKMKRKDGPAIQTPFVIGAVIDLGLCLDLMTAEGTAVVKLAYEDLISKASRAGFSLPVNQGGLNKLDCAVINWLHENRKANGDEPIDAVRGLFPEGKELYPGSAFMTQTHVQIAVTNTACIKGVFHVPERQLRPL
jgi:hypothetical protein